MKAVLKIIVGAGFLVCMSAGADGGEPSTRAPARETVRLGAVAYSPSAVTIFQGLTRYLNQNDFPCDYVLYSNYDALVAALDRGEVDIAWNTPLAHAQYHVKNACSSQTLVMRDVDFNVRSVLVVRAESAIHTPGDLVGKRLVLGSSQAAESTVLPMHFLKRSGVDPASVTIVSLDGEFNSEGNPCASPWHVLEALRAGRGDAGIITAEVWDQVEDKQASGLTCVWSSPPFSHCVFTAPATFDSARAVRFTELMTAMDPDDPETADVMRLEGTRQWLAGSPKGFEDLVEALAGPSRQ